MRWSAVALLLAGLVLAPAAGAVPTGYNELTDAHGCTFLVGPKKPSGYAPVRAECEWPELEVKQLDALLSALNDHQKYFSSVKQSKVLDGGAEASTVYWLHEAKGISNRVHHVLCTRTVKADGTIVHGWSMTGTQPAPGDDQVVPAVDTGRWELSARPGGGTYLVYEVQYEPGGSVPGFMVRWFQGTAIVDLIGELKAYAMARR